MTEYNDGPSTLYKEAGVNISTLRNALFQDAVMDKAISQLIVDFVNDRWGSVLAMANMESRKGVTHYAETCRVVLKGAFEEYKAKIERDRAIKLLQEQGYQVLNRVTPVPDRN
jgi:hypothetical protein